jgi:hemerythrin
MNIGIEEIDEQHMGLARAINALYDSNIAREREKAVKIALNMLIGYTEIHFKTEEDLMKSHDYPQYLEHKAEHDNFALKVLKLKENMDHLGYNLDYQEFTHFIRDWFLNHTQGTDWELAPFFKEKGLFGKREM